jgi:hypothetical protein
MSQSGSWVWNFVTKPSFKFSMNVGKWVIAGGSGERGLKIRSFKTPSVMLWPRSVFWNNWYAHYGRGEMLRAGLVLAPCYGRGGYVTVVTCFRMCYGRGLGVTTVTATKFVIFDSLIFFFYSFDGFLHCFLFPLVLSWVVNTCKKWWQTRNIRELIGSK